MTTTAATWAFVVISAVIAVFLIVFLTRLSRVASEGQKTLSTLNTRLPRLLDYMEGVLRKADSTVDRVNETMNEIEGPIHYIRMFTHLMTESRQYLGSKMGRGILALAAGLRAGKVIFESLRQHSSRGKGNALEE